MLPFLASLANMGNHFVKFWVVKYRQEWYVKLVGNLKGSSLVCKGSFAILTFFLHLELNSGFFFFLVFFVFLFFVFPFFLWHKEVLGPGIKSGPQLQTIPQLWQHWILMGDQTGNITKTSWITNPLHHNGNSLASNSKQPS